MPSTAKIFMTGRSQAVRLPKEFRFEESRSVFVGKAMPLYLSPCRLIGAWLDAIERPVDADFVESISDRPKEHQDALIWVFSSEILA